MRHPPVVAVRHGLQQYRARGPGLLLVVVALGDDAIEELPAVHGLGDEVEVVGLLEEVVDPDDVGAVAEGLEDADLVLEGGNVLLLELGAGHALDGVLVGGGAPVRGAAHGGKGLRAELRGI